MILLSVDEKLAGSDGTPSQADAGDTSKPSALDTSAEEPSESVSVAQSALSPAAVDCGTVAETIEDSRSEPPNLPDPLEADKPGASQASEIAELESSHESDTNQQSEFEMEEKQSLPSAGAQSPTDVTPADADRLMSSDSESDDETDVTVSSSVADAKAPADIGHPITRQDEEASECQTSADQTIGQMAEGSNGGDLTVEPSDTPANTGNEMECSDAEEQKAEERRAEDHGENQPEMMSAAVENSADEVEKHQAMEALESTTAEVSLTANTRAEDMDARRSSDVSDEQEVDSECQGDLTLGVRVQERGEDSVSEASLTDDPCPNRDDELAAIGGESPDGLPSSLDRVHSHSPGSQSPAEPCDNVRADKTESDSEGRSADNADPVEVRAAEETTELFASSPPEFTDSNDVTAAAGIEQMDSTTEISSPRRTTPPVGDGPSQIVETSLGSPAKADLCRSEDDTASPDDVDPEASAANDMAETSPTAELPAVDSANASSLPLSDHGTSERSSDWDQREEANPGSEALYISDNDDHELPGVVFPDAVPCKEQMTENVVQMPSSSKCDWSMFDC